MAVSRAQQVLARRAAESRATVPHLELSERVELRHERDGDDLSALLAFACARALREEPYGNGAYRDGGYELYERVNIGLLVQSGEDLDSVTLFDADRRSPEELRHEIEELRQQARAGTLAAPGRSGATFTLSRSGARACQPLIVPGQAAALCAGAPRREPVIANAAIVPSSVITITLACDHRILYGERAARLLAAISAHLGQADG